MKAILAAHLIAGIPAKVLSDDEAKRLTRGPVASAAPSAHSFVYVKGPNATVGVAADGRYTVAISGHYSVPNPNTPPADWILQSFAKRSTDCFTEINGSWRLLLLDHAHGTAVAATDRMGSQRVCYSESPGSLSFGSDSEIVARIRGVTPNINTNSILQYFYFHFVPSPGTLFNEVRCLPPAEFLAWNGRGASRGRYWKPVFAKSRHASITPAALLDTLGRSVADAASAGRTGAFLSGGLDSSTVVGLANRQSPGAVAPYTIGFDEPAYDETRYARIAAEHFGVRLNRYEVTPADVVDAIGQVAEGYDEPFGNSSAIPTYFCAKAAAAAGETRMLAGDGGDEIFAGNERYRTQGIFAKYDRLPAALRGGLIEPVFLGLFASTGFYPIRKVRRYVEQAKIPMPDRLQTYNFLHVHGMEKIFTPGFLEAVDTAAPLRHLQEVYAESETDCLVDKMLYLDWKLTLADNDLRKVVTMCEAAGVEVLFPMLDNRLIDASCEIPGEVKLRGGNLRDFFKKAVATLLPRATIEKSKHGFGLPFGPWFAKSAQLREHMVARLDNLGGRNIVRADYVDLVRKATLDEHAGFYGEIVWLMCVLESWLSARPAWSSYKL
jgi:asparagine synthase (glutamine-hydrolysing)